ncbi:MAG: alanine racemase [Candidatus Abawacabacteria bacterium]|nr:alanine racemase [Candidatus Abawacabacteria bacterium]
MISIIPATRVEVSLSALRYNLLQFSNILTEPTKILSIIKANAYGHGLEIAKALEELVIGFGVVTVEEGVRLRQLGIKKKLIVLGLIENAKDFLAAQEFNLEVALMDLDNLQSLSTQLPPLAIHIKLNTGLNRLGILPEQLPAFLHTLGNNPLIRVQGIYSHLADAENPASFQTKEQLKSFRLALDTNQPLVEKLEKHIANSASTLLFPQSHYDYVRVGISTYGIWPSQETLDAWEYTDKKSHDFQLKPALSYRTSIVAIQEISAGSLIGYAGTYRTRRKSRIATVPIGYYEGVMRTLSNKGIMLVNGKRAPIIGNVCMNMTMLDVSDIPMARKHSVVTFIGSDGAETISATEQSVFADTIPYLLLSNIPPHIPRIYQE